ncbi:hypothetical protein SEA_ASCELA_59 [Arthrobacter phage Ascela]|uniref:Uncharacterized protein n=1 Tax=Arthrobacter phage Ascela TaxID=3038360 RepID=A0AAF0GK69_9CAUD|nr:hypothetical protein SEA_ASCELA_59 [Arthrobacter phage Ascela]
MAAAQYTVLTEGLFPTSGKLLRTYPDAIVSTVVATGNPEEMKRLAAQLNAAEATLAKAEAALQAPEPPTTT